MQIQSLGANSPAELAKQYMSSRYSREPQTSSFRSRLFLENKGEASNVAYDGRFGQSVVQEQIEFGNENAGLPVNGYATTGIRGRSAICRMSCSPYFKVSMLLYILLDRHNCYFYQTLDLATAPKIQLLLSDLYAVSIYC